MTTRTGKSLGKYGERIFERDHFTCVYCGFDGRSFDNWMQLSWDHLVPQNAGGEDSLENIVTACMYCNFLTSNMKFAPGDTLEAILQKKRAYIAERRRVFHARWLETVASRHLDRPLPSPPRLIEDAADFTAFEERAAEPALPFEEVLENLRSRDKVDP